MATINSVAALIDDVLPFKGQDCQLVYTVYTDLSLSSLEDISAWTIIWSLFTNVDDAAALFVKDGDITTSSTVTITLADTELDTLISGFEYGMQLWRNDIGNIYPLTGIGKFIPQAAPPLST